MLLLHLLLSSGHIILGLSTIHEEGLCMSTRRLLLLVGLSLLFAGCSTGRYGDDSVYRNESSTNLGKRYLLGQGVPQNNEKAFYYFNQAARDDDPFAQNEVAYLYAAGKGTARDYSKA